METLGFNWGYLIVQILIFGIYPVLSLIALFALHRSRLTGIPKVLWALLIVANPIFGALAFFYCKPYLSYQS